MTRARLLAAAIIGTLLAVALEVTAHAQDAVVAGGLPSGLTWSQTADWIIVNRLGGYLVVIPAAGTAIATIAAKLRGWSIRMPALRIEVTVRSGDTPFEVRNVRTGLQRVAVEVVEDASGGEASLSEITPDAPTNVRRIHSEPPAPQRERRDPPPRRGR